MIWQLRRTREIAAHKQPMKSEQTVVALAHLASTAQFAEFANIAPLVTPGAALEVLLTYAPLLTPSSDLLFVKAIAASNGTAGDLMDSVAPTSTLHLLIDVSPVVVEERYRALKAHVAEQCEKYLFDSETQDDILLEFVKAITRRMDSEMALEFGDSLFSLVETQLQFQRWWNTVLVPYKYFNSKGGLTTLLQFESFASSDAHKIVDLFETLTNSGVDYLEPPFVQFLRSTEKSTLLDFIQELSIENDVSTLTSLKLFNAIVTLLFPHSEMKEQSLRLILDIYESFPSPTTEALQSISSTLPVLLNSNTSLTPDIASLNNAVNATLAFPLEYKTLSDLTQLCKDQSKQEQFFANVINSLSPSSASKFLPLSSILKPTLFPNLDEKSTRKLVMSRFLSLRLYSEIDVSPSDEEMVIEHFWTCFKTATNGSKDRGELNAGYRALQMVNPPTRQISRLVRFVEAVDELFGYSIYFKRGTPFRPMDLLTVEDLKVVAAKMLELNSTAYANPNQIHSLLEGLALGIQTSVPTLTDVECLCIDSSLVHDDFDFAYGESIKLFEKLSKDELEDKWDSFFQVAKYTSSEWFELDGTPGDVLVKQMELLSRILAVAPLKHAQMIVSQWRSDDLDLSIRGDEDEDGDGIVDQQPKSLDQRLARALSTTAGELLNDGKRAHVSNLLASGLGWIGGRQ